ncbi:hypothetical protein RI367_000124 [Sorochytrium milnesiophthora]
MPLLELVASLKQQASRSSLALPATLGDLYDAVAKAINHAIQTQNKELAKCSAAVVAECAKQDLGRESSDAKRVIPALARGLEHFHDDSATQVQFVRGLANLCVDNEVRHTKALSITYGMVSMRDTELCKNACGFVTNAMSQNDGVAEDAVKLGLLRGATEVLAASGTLVPQARFLIAKLFSLLTENEATTKDVVATNAIETTLKELQKYKSDPPPDIDNTICLLEVLDNTARGAESTRKRIYDCQSIPLLQDMMDHFADVARTQPQNMSENQDGEEENEAQIVLDLVERILVTVTQDDSVMAGLMSNDAVLSRLLSWVSPSEANDLAFMAKAIAGALMLGNIARSDDSAVTLVKKFGASERMIGRLKQVPSSGSKLILALVLALKNCSISAENKEVLGEQGVIETVAPLLGHAVPDIQRTSLGIIKQLVSNSGPNLKRVLEQTVDSTKETPLESVMKRYKTTDEVAFQSETGRLVAILLRQSMTLNTQSANFKQANRIIELTKLEPLWRLAGSTHALLFNEAIVALVVVYAGAASLSEDARVAMKEALTQLQSVKTSVEAALLDTGDKIQPIQIKTNTVRLLLTVVQFGPEYTSVAKELAGKAILKTPPSEAGDLVAVYRSLLEQIVALK